MGRQPDFHYSHLFAFRDIDIHPFCRQLLSRCSTAQQGLKEKLITFFCLSEWRYLYFFRLSHQEKLLNPKQSSLPLSNCSFKKGSSQMAGLERVFSSYFAAIWKDAVLSGAQVKKSERRGPFTIAWSGPHLLTSLKMLPLMLAWSQGVRWGVFHWDGRHWEREPGANKSVMSFRCDEFEGPVRHLSRANP